GLAALHALGVLHGDFTPDNILVRRDGSGVLIDLGCARPRGRFSEQLAGTPGFIAPELAAGGRAEPSVDLYAAGRCLKQLFELAGQRPPRELAELAERLCAEQPEQRPSDVQSVLAVVGARGARPSRGAWSARSLRLVGRSAERERFGAWLAELLAARPGPRVLALEGRRGAGKTRLLRELSARAELELSVLRCNGREPGALGALLGSAEAAPGARAMIGALAALRQQNEPTLFVVDDADLARGADAELLAQLARSLEPEARIGLLVAGVAPLPGLGAERIALAPLDAAALGEWTGQAFSQRTLAELARSCEGLPARIESALGRLSGDAPQARSQPSTELLASSNALSAPQRALLALVVALDGELAPQALGLDSADFEFALGPGLLQRNGASLQLSALVDREQLQRALGGELVQERHRELAARFASGALGASPAEQEAETARHLLLGGRAQESGARLLAAEALWRARPAPFTRLAELSAPQTPQALGCLLEICLLAQEPRRALSVAARLLRARPAPPLRERARVLGAEALTRLGRGARAHALLQRALPGLSAALRVRALLALGRARIQLADYAGVGAAAQQALQAGAAGADAALAQEALGVAALYGGRAGEADAHFAAAASSAALLAPRDRCRLFGYRALSAFRTGKPALARQEHARALEVAEAAGLDDLLATCQLNLGTALWQLGDLGGAIEQYQQGLAVARAVGRENTELSLRYNLINARIEVGDFERVRTDLELLEARAAQARLAHFAPALALARAEIALARGELQIADSALGSAARGFEQLGLERERIEAELGRAELELQRDQLDEAQARAAEAERRASALAAEDQCLRAELVYLRLGARRRDAAALERGRQARERAELAGQQLLAARLETELCFAAEACGVPRLGEAFEAARKTWDRLGARLPDELRQSFWADPRRAGLLRFTQLASAPGGAMDQAAALRRLLSLSRRINSSLSLERVLEYAVEAAVELCNAERGFLFLREADGSVRLSTRSGADPAARPSSSIVERVLSSGEALLTTDAGSDLRLEGFGSVHAQRLKAVLCVPVATPSEPLGALYVDSRLERTRLGEAARELLLSLADHVAVALSNARLHEQLARRSQQLQQEKRSVERLSSGKDRQLARLREQLEQQRRTLEFRYDYQQIAGRGERMTRVLHELDRIVDSDVNVLIQGESGTGKELIARAIHVHGARRAAPFVAVNCASIPEGLLESELFGHVRGAFTGAERDQTGLMLSASGGTLFLDEIGELSLATQAKLLRALQEREVRPLGAEKARPLDLRLVCATHRELAREVEAGRFRQDLFYRVAVLEVRLPALRERIEDLPELCRRILERRARELGRAPPELAPDALRALAAQPFPGNVRELENILTRALVLSGHARLRADDLDLSRPAPRALRSRSRREYEAEERERILHALRGARWNVSVVSRTLGIPRNTLYRKLERYGLQRPEQGPEVRR
ncbi:MAG TPA: sigma 54-interacting transcriptional regulator, partial [Polyangiaceae bacterium]|nr:sigma 54-interacting transcriptional regulator [Polyangiaceae bacterium]